MSTKFFSFVAVVSMSSVVAAYVHAATETRIAPPVETRKGVKVVRIGMSSEEVRRLLGKPAAIEPLKTPEGHAEVWTFRRPLDTIVRQAATSTHRVPSFSAPGSCQHDGMIEDPVFQMESRVTEEVTELLFFEDVLVCSKRAITEQRSLL